MGVSGNACILQRRTQAAFASILIPGLPEPYRKSDPKEKLCPLFFAHSRQFGTADFVPKKLYSKMEYNKKLAEIYQPLITGLSKMFEELNNSELMGDRNFSWPLLLRIWETEYDNAPVKLMIFGQETNGWNNQTESKIESNTVETLTEEYVLHDMGRGRMRSPFWRTLRFLNEALGNPDTNCFVWNNILKFGKEDGAGHPSDNVMAAEMQYLNVVKEELGVLKPEVCIFLTGPQYDSDIEKKFGDVKFVAVDGYNSSELARVENEALPKNSFRTYHPGFGNFHKDWYDGVLSKIVELCKRG